MAEENTITAGNQAARNKMPRRSLVWGYYNTFTDGDGRDKAECKRCRLVLGADTRSGTSTLWNHVKKICKGRHGVSQGHPTSSSLPLTMQKQQSGPGESSGCEPHQVMQLEEANYDQSTLLYHSDMPFSVVWRSTWASSQSSFPSDLPPPSPQQQPHLLPPRLPLGDPSGPHGSSNRGVSGLETADVGAAPPPEPMLPSTTTLSLSLPGSSMHNNQDEEVLQKVMSGFEQLCNLSIDKVQGMGAAPICSVEEPAAMNVGAAPTPQQQQIPSRSVPADGGSSDSDSDHDPADLKEASEHLTPRPCALSAEEPNLEVEEQAHHGPGLGQLQQQLFGRRVHRHMFSVTIFQYEDLGRMGKRPVHSELYQDAKAYLGVLCMLDGQEVVDMFTGATVWWTAYKSTLTSGLVVAWYALYYQPQHRELVLGDYLPYVRRKGRANMVRGQQRKIFTNTTHDGWAIPAQFEHHSSAASPNTTWDLVGHAMDYLQYLEKTQAMLEKCKQDLALVRQLVAAEGVASSSSVPPPPQSAQGMALAAMWSDVPDACSAAPPAQQPLAATVPVAAISSNVRQPLAAAEPAPPPQHHIITARRVGFQTWTWPNLVLRVTNDNAYIKVCAPCHRGMWTLVMVLSLLNKYGIDVVTAQIDSDDIFSVFNIYAHVTATGRENSSAALEVYQLAVAEILVLLSS